MKGVMTILCYILGGFLGGLWGAIVAEYFCAWYWKPRPTIKDYNIRYIDMCPPVRTVLRRKP
jgi:hypothetical protein